MSLRRLQFKLAGIHSFSLLGIDFTGKSAPADLSPADGLTLLQGFRSQRLPAELTLDILVQNPNDGSGGSTRTVSTLTSLESRLLVNDRSTVYGNIEKPVEIPGRVRPRRFRSGCRSTFTRLSATKDMRG